MQTNTENKNKKIGTILGVLFLLLIGIKWSLGLSEHMDILFGDEAEYMRNGLGLFKVIRNDWGPAYNLWYKALSFIFTDNIELYYANYIIGAIVVSILLFIALCTYNFRPITALYISFCFLVSPININTWPRISHFILILVLIALIIIYRIPSIAKKLLTLLILCSIACYARPDLLFVVAMLTPLTLYFIYQERKNIKSFIPLLLILLSSILFFGLVFGLPSSTYKGGLDRLYSAFCQHYTINYKYLTHSSFDAVTEWISFCKQKFPDCNTLSDIIRKHPLDFLQHFLFNLKNYVILLFTTFLSFLFPTGIYQSKKGIFIAISLLVGLIYFVLISKERRMRFQSLLKEHRLVLFFLFVFGLPAIGMCCIIFPRPHYLLLHSLLILFLLAILIESIAFKLSYRWLYIIPSGILLLLLGPRADHYKYMQFGKDMNNLCDQQLIRYLQKNKTKKFVVLTNYLNITYLLPKNYSEFSTEFELKEEMDFSLLIKEKGINIVLVSENIIQNPILRADTMWNNLLIMPEKYQFKKVKYSDICESYLLIKE